MLNIYCDESCHLQLSEKNRDDQVIMAIGGISCSDHDIHDINLKIRNLKREYKIFKSEVKWTKVSRGKIDFYKSLIDLFFESDELNFRIILTDKRLLYYQKYSHDDIYYIMYYYLLREMITITENNAIYIDKKDTNGGERVRSLRKCLCNQRLDFNQELIQRIQIVNSKDCELMQLADLLIGAVVYENRDLKTSPAKREIVEYIKGKTRLTLKNTVPSSYSKFNIFMWGRD